MRGFNMRLLIITLLILLQVIIPLQAQDETKDEPVPQLVEVAVYVAGLSEFNLETGTYNANFHLDLFCEFDCDAEAGMIDIIGVNSSESLNLETRSLEPTNASYGVQATLNQNDIDLSRYPFDSHKLNIIIEAKFMQNDILKFVNSTEITGIDADVALQGWNLSRDYQVSIVEKLYPGEEIGFARYILTLSTKRVAIAAFIRSLLPALIILLISFLGTFLPDKNNRIGLAGGILLAMLLHHLAVSAEIPAVGYPVYFDAFMLLNDAAILLQFAGTVYELVQEQNGVDRAVLNRFAFRSLIIVSTTWLIGQIIVWQMFMSM